MSAGEDVSGASPVTGERALLPAGSPAAPATPSLPVPVKPRPRPAPDDAVPYGLRVTAGYAWRLVLVAIAVYLVFVVLGTLTFVAVAVFAGLVITALLRPLVDLLAHALPRGVAVLAALLMTLLALGGVVTFIANSVAGQSARLSVQFGHGLADLERSLSGSPFHLRAVDLGRLGEQARTWVTANTAALVSQALGGAGVAVELLTGVALAIFCSVFFLASGERIWAWVSVQLGAGRHHWDAAARAGWATFAGYTRGVVIIAASNAILVGVALVLLRVPLALPLALLVFFAAFVPLVGAPIALAVATLVALAARGPVIAILVVVLTVLIGQVEGHILHPLVMSRAVNLHPLAVALSVASGTVLAGVIGAVVAVPLVAVAWTVWSVLRATPPGAPTGPGRVARG
jgi:putative heme transporter